MLEERPVPFQFPDEELLDLIEAAFLEGQINGDQMELAWLLAVSPSLVVGC